ncbi:MAG: 50S ribosomal protein L11 methyltransferase [Bacteroidaceae bacterium]|nr:50S ribosomal protein L11 methyltransferase [Bacteroidaceae bacterium]
MKYYEVKFSLSPYSEDAGDVLSALLADIGFETFSPSADGLTAYIQQSLFKEEELRGLVEEFIFPAVSISYRVEEAPDEDWNQTWENEGFAPIVIDDLLCVHDTKHTDVPPCRYDIIINPRMAFGTGTHPTTRQILHHLCNTPLQGKRIVDAGCGTGVLGILCALRGAQHIFSYDIDSWSVENTRINAQLNQVENLTVREGDVCVLPQEGDYDLLVANINRNILLSDMPQFARTLTSDGRMLLSGFYEADAPMLIEKGKDLGFSPELQQSAEGWAMLLLRRL